MEQLTTQKLEEIVKEYFNYFFTDIKVYTGFVNGRDAVGFDGLRNGNKFAFSTNQVFTNPMLYHWLESIKGECITAEETILLEHQKAAD
jgi:hypothetical protein